MASCFVDDTGVAPESFSLSPCTTNWKLEVPPRFPQVSHFRSIDPGAKASTGTVFVRALIHRTLILIFRTLIQLIFSCVLINRQNNYFSHVH